MSKSLIYKAVIFSCLFIFDLSSIMAFTNQFPIDRKSCPQDLDENMKMVAADKNNMSMVKYDPNHPDTVIFAGRITGVFLEALDTLPPNITRIAIENPQGGDAYAALLIAQKIRNMGLETYVGKALCFSACTVVYQGGIHRVADPNARFGYHGPSGTGTPIEDVCSLAIQSSVLNLMITYGLIPEQTSLFKSNIIITHVTGQNLIDYGIVNEFKSLNIGSDSSITSVQESIQRFCEENPYHDEC